MVVLPDPLGPMSVTRSPGATSKSSSRSTTLSPKRLTTLSKRMIGSPLPRAPVGATPGAFSVSKAYLQLSQCDGRGIARRQEDQAGEGDRLEVAEADRADRLGALHHLRDGDQRQERCLL